MTTDFERSAKFIRCAKSAKYLFNDGHNMSINDYHSPTQYVIRSTFDRDISRECAHGGAKRALPILAVVILNCVDPYTCMTND